MTDWRRIHSPADSLSSRFILRSSSLLTLSISQKHRLFDQFVRLLNRSHQCRLLCLVFRFVILWMVLQTNFRYRLPLRNNQLTSLPNSFGQLTNLTEYDIHFDIWLQFSSLSSIGSIFPITYWNRCRIQSAIWRTSNCKTLFKFLNIVNHRSFSFSLNLKGNSDLPKQFQQDICNDHTAVLELLSDISIYYRRRAAARRAALFIIARYGEGDLAVFNRDLIKLIANEVWKTREDPTWLDVNKQSDLRALRNASKMINVRRDLIWDSNTILIVSFH